MSRERDIAALTATIAVQRGRMTPLEWGREEVSGLLAAGLYAAGYRPAKAPVANWADLVARRLGKAGGAGR